MTFGENLKRTRKRKGWTQKQLADAMGITQSAVNQWEHSVRNPKKETVKRIADALGVSVRKLDSDYFLSERDKPMEITKIGFLSSNDKNLIWVNCPSCNCFIDHFPPHHLYNYCWNCGQALEWREEYDVDETKIIIEDNRP